MQSRSQPLDFIADPARDGIANALWATISVGALGLSGATPEQFRFNTNHGLVRADALYGEFQFSVNFPTTVVQTPTDLADDISFGLENASMGTLGRIEVFVDQGADSIVFRSYDELGTVESTTLTWNTAWNSAQTIFKIAWSKGVANLVVIPAAATAETQLANHTTSVPNRPLNPFVNAVGADNFDVDWIVARNLSRNSFLLI